MNAEEHHQQQLEQQQYEADMKAAAGEPDMCQCSACTYFGVLNTWTAEGFEIKFGKEVAAQLLDRPLAPNSICTDGTLRDTDFIALCRECEFIQDWHDMEVVS